MGFENPNNYHFGVADFARIGFELVDHIHNVEHDTHCFILKDAPRGVSEVALPPRIGWTGKLTTCTSMPYSFMHRSSRSPPNVTPVGSSS